MTIKDRVQEAMKEALRGKEKERLECLRMAKGALLMKEKASSDDLTEEVCVAVLRAEVKKRQQSLDIFKELGKEEEVAATEREIAIIEEFLPQQLSYDQLAERVKGYLEAHPDVNHAGKLTGAMKKELGDQADGKMLNELCRKALGG